MVQKIGKPLGLPPMKIPLTSPFVFGEISLYARTRVDIKIFAMDRKKKTSKIIKHVANSLKGIIYSPYSF